MVCEPTETPQSPPDRSSQPRLALAVDIGGTKLAVGVVSGDGELLERYSTPTPNVGPGGPVAPGDDEALFEVLASLVARVAPYHRFEVCGVGCGGPMSLGGVQVSPLNIPAWRQFPLAARLRALTGLPTRVDNDAKALALAEGWVGAAAGQRNFMAMVVSTGVGGGIVLDGRLLEGQEGNAGHVGHMAVAWPGRALPGHVTGVLEAEASGTALAHHSGRPAAVATQAERVETGTLVGRAAGSVVNLLDLPLVVVAGSVALGFGPPFFTAAQAELDRLCQLEFSRQARIEPAGCGDQGPLIGAAAVGFRALGVPLGAIEAPATSEVGVDQRPS